MLFAVGWWIDDERQQPSFHRTLESAKRISAYGRNRSHHELP